MLLKERKKEGKQKQNSLTDHQELPHNTKKKPTH